MCVPETPFFCGDTSTCEGNVKRKCVKDFLWKWKSCAQGHVHLCMVCLVAKDKDEWRPYNVKQQINRPIKKRKKKKREDMKIERWASQIGRVHARDDKAPTFFPELQKLQNKSLMVHLGMDLVESYDECTAVMQWREKHGTCFFPEQLSSLEGSLHNNLCNNTQVKR